MQGFTLPSSINPNPFFIRRGFDLHPKPLCPLQGRGLTAPPVALTLMYPRPIKGSGCFLSTTLDAGRLCERRLGPSARSLIAYMSGASLKKGPACFLSTTLNAGRYGCGSSIMLIIYTILKHRGYKGRGALFLIMSQPIFLGVGGE